MRGPVRHLCHIGDLTVADMDRLLDSAEKLLPASRGEARLDLADGKILATLFFEPSTRTRLSFESAMHRLGGDVISVAEPGSTSSQKGETLTDTIRMVAAYSDVIVLRHPREGAARLAARASRVPVVNGGDGAGQHPTQTLADLFTIRKAKGTIAHNTVAIAGDLKYGRTVHSLAQALAMYGVDMIFVAPEALQVPQDMRDHLERMGAKVRTAATLEEVIAETDVLYMTRIQKERFPDLDEYRKVQGVFKVTNQLLANGKKGIIVMHPLPRVGEIDASVDETPAAKYFEQAAYGVPVRMALLADLLGLDTGALPSAPYPQRRHSEEVR
ncbi:MAG TPA: aspartate carbamoyltransferase [Candidatus Thermoplasmatota archaeon]|nr:aspartate carbamoyltransferase [Candidatus Thermoplasmatota archaeon]